jgi:DNA-binding CsgD family transcriptional regulator
MRVGRGRRRRPACPDRPEALLAPTVTRRLVAEFSRLRVRRRKPDAALRTLTARENDLLRLIAEGLSNTEIAARLVVGEQTVKSHVSRVLTKPVSATAPRRSSSRTSRADHPRRPLNVRHLRQR